MTKLTFVVPVYKVKYDLLQLCIDSILGQSSADIELILVDDGSPDDCGAICDANAEKDSRIQVIHKKNGGLSDARNSGLLKCSTEWVTFVDGDDWVDKDFAETFFERIKTQEEKADIYIYTGYRNYPSREVQCSSAYPDGTRFVTYEDREELQKECCLVPTKKGTSALFIGSGWAKIFRTEYLKKEQLLFPIVPYGEDSIFFLYSVEKAAIVEYVAKSIYHYRDTEGGLVRGYRDKADEHHKIYCDAIFKFAQEYNKKAEFIDVLYYRVFIAMQRCIEQKFYNPNNPVKGHKRWKECKTYMSSKPFGDVYRHISFSRLNRNNKIKYILMRLKLYGLMQRSKTKFQSNQGVTTYK